MAETKEKTTKTTVKKSQKVKVLVSVYRVNDKIVSALGIPSVDTPVKHVFQKDKIRVEDLFVFTTQIRNHLPFSKMDTYRLVVDQALDDRNKEIHLPETKAKDLQNIGTFIHEVLSIEIELLS